MTSYSDAMESKKAGHDGRICLARRCYDALREQPHRIEFEGRRGDSEDRSQHL